MPDPIIMARGLVVRPGDSLIVATPDHLEPDEAEALKRKIMRRMPGLAEVIVITRVTSMAAFRPETPQEIHDA
jgi:hypothetical protein